MVLFTSHFTLRHLPVRGGHSFIMKSVGIDHELNAVAVWVKPHPLVWGHAIVYVYITSFFFIATVAEHCHITVHAVFLHQLGLKNYNETIKNNYN